MAIGFEDQFYFGFSIGDRQDFIQTWDDLVTFKVIESTGNVLPTWEILFYTGDEAVLAHLNEGNDLEVSYGRNPDETKTSTLAIQRVTKSYAGQDRHQIYANGLFSALGYISNPGLFISSRQSGVATIKEVVESHFNIGENDFNIESSEDIQRWAQYNISDRRFVNEIWMHSFIRGSFICVGITSDGRFVLKDMRELFAEDPSWVFTIGTTQESNEIVYDPDPVLDAKTGFINAWLGRGRERVIHDIEAGTSADLFVEPEPLIAASQQLARRADLVRRHGETRAVNDNVHPQYWEAYMRNLTNLAVFSSDRITLSFSNVFRDVQVLDHVVYNEAEVSSGRIAEVYSGEYVVSKVSREVSNRQFATTVELCREAANAIRGNFRSQGQSEGVAE